VPISRLRHCECKLLLSPRLPLKPQALPRRQLTEPTLRWSALEDKSNVYNLKVYMKPRNGVSFRFRLGYNHVRLAIATGKQFGEMRACSLFFFQKQKVVESPVLFNH
jgi:hypothetical protein